MKILILILMMVPFGYCSAINGKDQNVNCVSNTTSSCNFSGMASVVLNCSHSGMNIGFNMSELDANILPYRILFNDSNCDHVNKSSNDSMKDGQIWLASNYSDCGIQIKQLGNEIIFETLVKVEYGAKSASKLIYRYFEDTYNLKCILDRNITKQLQLNVKDRKIIQATTNETAEFTLDFKVFNKDSGDEATGMTVMGAGLKFVLELPEDYTNVKVSPQDCYATKLDGTGRYNLITNRCVGEDNTVKILTKSNATHKFEWEMLAFRYFGDSDGMYITCNVLACQIDDVNNTKCQRCGARRKRRDVFAFDGRDSVMAEKSFTTRPIFIIETQTSNTQSNASEQSSSTDFLSKPEGTAIICIVAVFVFVVCAVIIKKVFFASAAAGGVKAAVVSFDNPAME